MLILTRGIDETVIIGDDVKITILQLHRNQVRLGVSAPRDVEVYREEVHQRIHQQGVGDVDSGDC